MDKRKMKGLHFRRRFVQLASAVAYNMNFRGFESGRLYRGAGKGVCVPGLNCYSCPGAVGACPLGSLQASLNNLPALPLYVLGLLMIFGALFGRMVCAFLCPFGLVQELLHKIPSPKIKKNNLTRRLSLIKYAILVLFVVAYPVYTLIQSGVVTPGFCKYICPVGILEGGIPMAAADASIRAGLGWLFGWKGFVLASVLVLSVFLYRPFCRFLCPLGAIYSLFNRVALLGIKMDEGKCKHCGLCAKDCPMDTRIVNDRECIRCGECAHKCPFGAISFAPCIKRPKDEEATHEKDTVDAADPGAAGPARGVPGGE